MAECVFISVFCHHLRLSPPELTYYTHQHTIPPTIPINIQYHLLCNTYQHTILTSVTFSFTLYTIFPCQIISFIQDSRIWCEKLHISNSVHLYKGKFATPAVERRYQEDFTCTITTNTTSCQQHCKS